MRIPDSRPVEAKPAKAHRTPAELEQQALTHEDDVDHDSDGKEPEWSMTWGADAGEETLTVRMMLPGSRAALPEAAC